VLPGSTSFRHYGEGEYIEIQGCVGDYVVISLMSGPSILRGEASLLSISSGIVPAMAEGSNSNSPQARTPTTPRPRPTRPRGGSSVSRVGVDYFDPAGVEELRRVLTERSNHDLQRVLTGSSIPDVPHLEEKQDPTSLASSTITLAGLKVEDGFDLEKTVRHIVRK
jgi:ATP-binding cassette subfamily G (WHITE) protein 2 (SNQ2)